MSKGTSEKVSLELAFLELLDIVHADVDTSEIAEIQDWSRAVRGKFYGVAVKDASGLSKRSPNATNEPVSSPRGVSGIVLGGSSNVASYRSVQYSQMAIPQLVAVCKSESNEGAWTEFVRRFQPLIAAMIAKVARRFGKISHELVDDLTQETFLKVCHDNLRALRGVATAHENAFYGFLKIVATHTVQDYFRSAAACKRGGAYELEAPIEAPNASSALEREILLQEIDSILKTLSHEPNFERDHAIFWLYYSQGLTAKEIAALPGVKLSVKGVESTLLRLTREIRVSLTQKGEKAQLKRSP